MCSSSSGDTSPTYVKSHGEVFPRTWLSYLRDTWNSYIQRQRPGAGGGLLQRAKQLFKPSLGEEVSDSVSRSITQLDRDWLFLNLLVVTLELLPGIKQNPAYWCCQRMLDVGEEVSKYLHYGIARRDYYMQPENYKPQEWLKLFGDCQMKTDCLPMAEISHFLSDFLRYPFSVHNVYFKRSYISLVMEGEMSIKDIFRSAGGGGGGSLEKQLSACYVELKFFSSYHEDEQNRLMVDIVTRTVVTIALQSCDIWLKGKLKYRLTAVGLVDMLQEIDPTDPRYIQQYREKYRRSYERGVRFPVDLFCSYLLLFDSRRELRTKLMPLVSLFFESDYNCTNNVDCLLKEIDAVFAEAAFLPRVIVRRANFSHPTDLTQYSTEYLPPCSQLIAKILLLNTELLLKQLSGRISGLDFKLENILTKLRTCIQSSDLPQQRNTETEFVKRSLALIKGLGNEIESLGVSLNSVTNKSFSARHTIQQMLFEIVFFKADSFLTELLKSNDGLISHQKDQIKSLVEGLKYCKGIVTNKVVTSSSDEEAVIKQVEAVARRIFLLSYSFLPHSEKMHKTINSLPQLLDEAQIVKEKLGQMCQQFPMHIFPKTNLLGFIDSLGRNVRELIKYDPKSIAPVKNHFKEVQLHLETLKSFVINSSSWDVEQRQVEDIGNHIAAAAYKLQPVIELIEIDGNSQPSIWLYPALEDIRLLVQQVSEIHNVSYPGEVQNVGQISGEMKSLHTMPAAVNEEVVDLGDDEEAIIGRLTRGTKQRDVVCIVGMPGIGKTTLARRVYDNQNIIYHFHCRAWCTVSQTYSKRELVLEILSDIHGLTEEIHRMTNEDLLLKLRRCLLKRRYLIVMDDVWDIEAWNDIEKSFPNDSNGSRILITSRLQDVRLQIKPERYPHSVRFLSDDECWELLEKKIFKGGACPKELSQVGMEIAQNCQGLPLAVVAIAGILQKTEKRQDCWKKVSKSLSSEIINDPENRCKEILELSYKHLPEHLKACFLYLGFFLEDKDIPVSKLIRFWMAEGFIQETESKSLEDVAEEYLMELINRSLVNVSKTRSNGKVKACGVHDLIRDLCLLKAKNDNFFKLVTRYDEPYSSLPELDYGMEFDYVDELASVPFESYRLGIYLKRNHFIDSTPFGPSTRALLFFASADPEPRCPYDISFICHHFKLLRILDLECINMGVSFPDEIGLMVRLTYLAVSGYLRSVPASIAKLRKLETLIVVGLRGMVTLPGTIWSMARLRHLHVNKHVAFSLEGSKCSLQLDNIVSFSTPTLSCGKYTTSIFRRFPNLRKMKCIFLEARNYCEHPKEFPLLEFLSHLESLKITYYGKALESGEFSLPLNLRKLTLSNFRLPWTQIARIGGLPNLIVLKLLAGAFKGQTWDMQEEEFKKLKFLELDSLNIVVWNASCDHLPNLEKLVLRNCKDLEKIPHDFAGINTLQMIHVQWCGQSVEVSAKEIGDATQEIKVLINYS